MHETIINFFLFKNRIIDIIFGNNFSIKYFSEEKCPMYYNKVEICGVNTAELILLDDGEKNTLLYKTKTGDLSAREELICGNLRLVLSIIKRFSGRRENVDDLFQVGCLGLVKAVDNFNTELGVKFSTYAVPMIIGEIRRYLRDNNMLRISRSIRDLAYKALRAREDILRDRECEPSLDEIAQALDVTKEALSEAMEAVVEPISIYEPVYTDGGDSLYVIDQLADVTGGDDSWLEGVALKDALHSLCERERSIITMRYYMNKTQTEIASEIGISQAQVSRLEKAALEKMRRKMT